MKRAFHFVALAAIMPLLCLGQYKPTTQSTAIDKNTARIAGHFDGAFDGDSLSISVWSFLLNDNRAANVPDTHAVVPVIKGAYQFPPLQLARLGYCSIRYITKHYVSEPFVVSRALIAPGDRLQLDIRPDSLGDYRFHLRCRGHGASKWNCFSQLQDIAWTDEDSLNTTWWAMSKGDPVTVDNFFSLLNLEFERRSATLRKQWHLCNAYQPSLTKQDYNLLRVNSAGLVWAKLFDAFYDDGYRHFLLSPRSKLDSTQAAKLKIQLWVFYWKHLQPLGLSGVSSNILAACPSYLNYLTIRLKAEAGMTGKPPVPAYSILDARFEGRLHDRLLTLYFLTGYNYLADGDSLLQDAMRKVEDEPSQRLLQQLWDRQHLGSRPYDFALPDTTGRLVRLHDFQDKIVYLDFWFTGCGACEHLYQEVVSQLEARYALDTNVVFVSISIDRIRSQWMASIYRGNNASPAAINLYTNGLGDADPVISAFNVWAYPRVMLIDQRGAVAVNDAHQLTDLSLAIQSIEHLRRGKD